MANGRLGPPFDHLALAVRLPDGSGPWLADVGFGSHSDFPLLLDSRSEQDDPAGRFLLADTAHGDVDVLKDGEPQYRIELRERSLGDFVPTCWWQQTSPSSHFTRSTICSRLTDDGRISISGRTLIRTSGRSRTEQQLASDDASARRLPPALRHGPWPGPQNGDQLSADRPVPPEGDHSRVVPRPGSPATGEPVNQRGITPSSGCERGVPTSTAGHVPAGHRRDAGSRP